MTTPPSNEYWQKRFENLTEALLRKGEDEYKNLVEGYNRAIASLQRSIENFYYRFAEHNKVSYSDAKRILDKRELKEFRWTVEEYIERGVENALDQRWMNELENASIRIRVSRFESLKYQVRQQIELISAKRLSSVAEVAEDIFKEGYYKSIYEIQKGFGISDYFNVLDEKTVESTISKPWAPDGKDFSKRIWEDRDKLVAELEKELTHSFIRGILQWTSGGNIWNTGRRRGLMCCRSACCRSRMIPASPFLLFYHSASIRKARWISAK